MKIIVIEKTIEQIRVFLDRCISYGTIDIYALEISPYIEISDYLLNSYED